MDAGMTLIGMTAIIGIVAIVAIAIVFGRGFKGRVSRHEAAIEVTPASSQTTGEAIDPR